MSPAKINFRVYQGSTFEEVLRWESATKTYATISAISKAAPCVVTVNSGQPTPPVNWRTRISGVGGMKEINLLSDNDYYLTSSIVSNQITYNDINSANYTTYTSGGILEWNSPIPVSTYTAQMQIRESVDSSTVILELTTANGGISINSNDYTIAIRMTSQQTAAFTFITAVYSLELTNTLDNRVLTFVNGNLTLIPEVTR